MPPRAAIVGSVDTTRILEPPVKNPVLAREACAEIGRELADAGWDIEVYSANTTFIEADVVHGYLSGDAAARPNSIHVRAPVGKSAFDEVRDYPEIFDFQPDPSRDWEVTFYRQLVRSDAVILIGGGRSTFVAGLIALAIGIPLLPLAGLGGAATKVWERLANEKGLAADEDIAEMAKEWTKYSAKRLIE